MSPSEQSIIDILVARLKDVCKGELHKREAVLVNKHLLRVTLYYKNAPSPPALNEIEGATGATLEMFRLQDKNDIAFLITLSYWLSESEFAALREDSMYKDLRCCLLDPFDNMKSEIAELEGSLEKCREIASSDSDIVERLEIIGSSAATLKDMIDNFSSFLLNEDCFY